MRLIPGWTALTLMILLPAGAAVLQLSGWAVPDAWMGGLVWMLCSSAIAATALCLGWATFVALDERIDSMEGLLGDEVRKILASDLVGILMLALLGTILLCLTGLVVSAVSAPGFSEGMAALLGIFCIAMMLVQSFAVARSLEKIAAGAALVVTPRTSS